MKSSRQIIEQRQEEILRMLETKKSVTVEELAQTFGVSLMTIRRDLKGLESRRRLTRTHGGALVRCEEGAGTETPEERVRRCRREISRYAATFVENGDILFINGSVTALDLLHYVGDRSTLVYTNNCRSVGEVYPDGVTLMLTGGQVRAGVMIGEYVMRNLLTLQADKTFLGCAAVYEDAEFRYDIPTEIGINELMVSRTGKSVFVLADHTKLLRRETKDNAYGSISYDSPITLITDAYADREIIKKLEEHGMRVLIAPEGA